MITVICSTNRPGNVTRGIAALYCELLTANDEEAQLLSMEDLPMDFAFRNDVYGGESSDFHRIIQQFIMPVQKLVVISPEYNGSIPGVFKAFIDGIWPEILKNKKAALVGIASGRAGNVRGMDHLTNIFNYLGIAVLPMKVPISGIDSLLKEGQLADQKTIELLNDQAEALIEF